MLLEIAEKLSFAFLMMAGGLAVLMYLGDQWDERRKQYIHKQQQLDELDEIRKEGL